MSSKFGIIVILDFGGVQMDAGERDEAQAEVPALRRSEWRTIAGKRPVTRSELTAQTIAASIKTVGPGGRLGTKQELRVRCGVSLGTLNEAIRLLQAQGLVSVRPGPGGGLFACEPPPMVRLGTIMLALDSHNASVAEAVRIRNALDALLIEDAVRHAYAADIAKLRERLSDLAAAAQSGDDLAFVRANCALHTQIAAVSPNAILRSIYVGLIDVIESHTLAVVPAAEQLLPESLAQRYRVHACLIDAIAAQDHRGAVKALAQHNATEVGT